MKCLMSGTGADRAVLHYNEAFTYQGTTYFDMLVDKKFLEESGNSTFTSEHIMSKYKVDDNMDAIPDVSFYDYNFSDVLAKANELNPSWAKWVADPAKNEVFPKAVLGELLASASASGMIPSIQDSIGEPIKGIELFIPRTTKTSDPLIMDTIIAQINEIANEGYYIIELTGRTTTGFDSETYAKKQIKIALKLGKIPLIVSAGHIGSRSFSLGILNVIVLMYDGGSVASTGQNLSRGLTRGKGKIRGNVINASIDSTRESPLARALLETAVKHAEDTGIDIITAQKRVLRSINVLAVDSNGDMVPVNPDDYLAHLLKSNNLTKVVGTTSNPQLIMNDPEAIQKLFGMMGERVTMAEATSIGKKGKTFAKDEDGKPKPRDKNDSDEVKALKLWNKIIEQCAMIGDNAQNIAAIAESDTFTGALDIIIDEEELTTIFEDEFKVDPDFILELITSKVINGKLLDTVVWSYNNEQIIAKEEFLKSLIDN